MYLYTPLLNFVYSIQLLKESMASNNNQNPFSIFNGLNNQNSGKGKSKNNVAVPGDRPQGGMFGGAPVNKNQNNNPFAQQQQPNAFAPVFNNKGGKSSYMGGKGGKSKGGGGGGKKGKGGKGGKKGKSNNFVPQNGNEPQDSAPNPPEQQQRATANQPVLQIVIQEGDNVQPAQEALANYFMQTFSIRDQLFKFVDAYNENKNKTVHDEHIEKPNRAVIIDLFKLIEAFPLIAVRLREQHIAEPFLNLCTDACKEIVIDTISTPEVDIDLDEVGGGVENNQNGVQNNQNGVQTK